MFDYIAFSLNNYYDDYDDDDDDNLSLLIVLITRLLLMSIYRRSKMGVRRYRDTAREAQREAYEALRVIAFTVPYTPS